MILEAGKSRVKRLHLEREFFLLNVVGIINNSRRKAVTSRRAGQYFQSRSEAGLERT